MLQSQVTQSLDVFEMCFLRAIRGVTRTDRLQNIKIREDIFTPKSIKEVIRHKRWFVHVYITSLGKHTNRILQDSRKEWWSDQVQQNKIIKHAREQGCASHYQNKVPLKMYGGNAICNKCVEFFF